MNICEMKALEISKAIKEKKTGVRETVGAFLEAIARLDGGLHCYNTVCQEEALKRADEVQAGLESGKYAGPLAGVPVGVNDNICTKGVLTTCSSKMLENFMPTYDATAVERLKAAGMIILGKLNTDEFAMGSTTETSISGPTHNPRNTDFAPGGSSGGAAAAVAAGLAPLTLGSDTGGSLLKAASFCGVTGLKPTYGAVSRRGLIAYASSLDQIGALGKNAADCAALFGVIEGKDEKDATSADRPGFEPDAAAREVRGLDIGLPEEYFGENVEPEIKKAVLAAADTLRGLGARVETFSLPELKYAVQTFCIIASAEASSNLARYDGIKYGYSVANAENLQETYIKTRSEGFGTEVKRRILLGNFVLGAGHYEAFYNRALKAKWLIQHALFDALDRYELLLGPGTAASAPKLGESLSDPLKTYLGDFCTAAVSLAGLPSLSVPCGFDGRGLPIGLQLIGKPFAEAQILGAAGALEDAAAPSLRTPALR